MAIRSNFKRALKKLLREHGFTLCRTQDLVYLTQQMGYTVFQTADPPIGLSLAHDIKRLANTQAIETIFDVGANVGQTTQFMAHAFTDADIWAFEPIRESFDKLTASIAHMPRTNAYQLAFGAQEGSMTVTLRPNSEWNSLVPTLNFPASSPKPNQLVEIETIDRFGAAHSISKIDLLKTDTEGYDFQVLQGASNYFAENRVLFVFTEVGFVESDVRHTFFPQIDAWLRSQNFDLYGLYDVSRPVNSGIAYCNALYVNFNALNGTKR